MKHEVTTLNTKKALAASLKKLMGQKELSKITISELVADCHMNRKTFYYHFLDIYDLLKWMLEEEAIKIAKQYVFLVDYREAILFALDYVEKNEHMINCIYDSIGREKLKDFFYADFNGLITYLIDKIIEERELQISDDFKTFLCIFCTEAIAGSLVEYLQNRNIRNHEKAVAYISLIFQASLPHILEKAARDKK